MTFSWNNKHIEIPPVIFPVLIGVACLVPFLNKAFHIDDPMFLWAAQHIQNHPFDFYGLPVNWYNTETPMSEVMTNPPLASYYLALAASLLGWSELALHLAFLIPAGCAIWGTYRLAESFCSRPMLATLAALLTPAFLVSSTTVMCDTLMLCFWVWAVVFWDRGIQRRQTALLFVSGILIGLCALTKYFGMSLIPLLAVYALGRKSHMRMWPIVLLIPVFILIAYLAATHALYGRGLLRDAATFVVQTRAFSEARPVPKLFQGLAFTGGCVASVAFYVPLLWSRWLIVAGFVLMGIIVCVFPFIAMLPVEPLYEAWGFSLAVDVQFCIFAAAGLHLLALTVMDIWKQRDAVSLLLFLWILGTFLFATLINWAINGRSILPLVPAAGIILARRIDRLPRFRARAGDWTLYCPLIPTTILALLVAYADQQLANSARTVSEELRVICLNKAGVVRFQGHWGFQYYMQQWGARARDLEKDRWKPGDLLIVSRNNYYPFHGYSNILPPHSIVHEVKLSACPWLSTMDTSVRAGFYADTRGCLPFAFGEVAEEVYQIVEMK